MFHRNVVFVTCVTVKPGCESVIVMCFFYHFLDDNFYLCMTCLKNSILFWILGQASWLGRFHINCWKTSFVPSPVFIFDTACSCILDKAIENWFVAVSSFTTAGPLFQLTAGPSGINNSMRIKVLNLLAPIWVYCQL